MNRIITEAVQPPKDTIVLRPRSYRQVLVVSFLSIFSLVIIGMAIVLSPYILLILFVTIPGIVLPILYIKNGFVRVSPDAVELSGFTGKIVKRISYESIYKVILAENLYLSISNGAQGYSVVFLGEKGDQLYFLWSVQYSKEQITALYDLFDDKDKVRYAEPVRLNKLKDKVLNEYM